MSGRVDPHVRRFRGQRLRELRKARGLSQGRLGRKASLSGKFIGEVERGEQSISIDSVYKLSVTLEVPLNALTDVRPATCSSQGAPRPRPVVSGDPSDASVPEPPPARTPEQRTRMGLSIAALRSLCDTLARNQHVSTFYEKLPRTSLWGQQNYAVSTSIIRQAADTHDLIHQMQRTPLFGVNSDTEVRMAAIDWLVRRYESCGIDIDALPAEVEESGHSCPDISILRAGRLLSIDFLRTLAVAYDIRRHIQQSRRPLHVVELGAGLGHLARTLRVFGVSRSHVILDLPESLIFSYAFIAVNFPDASTIFITEPEQAASIRPSDYDFVFAPSCFAESIDFADAELFVNTASLGEMDNRTIRYWMDFVQHRMPVTYLFTQNRFLNTIDPRKHAWRWDENECSVHYDSSWTILKWDLEPPWYQCPYITPLSARSLDIVATRESPHDPRAVTERARGLLEEVKQEDWFRFADTPPDMTVRQNRFITDVTMTGALFKLWESIRLRPTPEAVSVMLRYLDVLIHNERLEFEETPYYQQLFLNLAQTGQQPESELPAASLLERHATERRSPIELVDETRGYNIFSVAFTVSTATGPSVAQKYYAIDKAIEPAALFLGRLVEREAAGRMLVTDARESIIEKATIAEHERQTVVLEGHLNGYNIILTRSGYLAVARSLGHIDLFQERIGERELAPLILKATTYEDILGRITG